MAENNMNYYHSAALITISLFMMAVGILTLFYSKCKNNYNAMMCECQKTPWRVPIHSNLLSTMYLMNHVWEMSLVLLSKSTYLQKN